MNELTDLQIIKRIAEIEGLINHIYFNKVQVDRTQNKSIETSWIGWEDYNPLTDDGLCFRLIIKHDIVRVWESYDQLGWYYTDLQNYLNTTGNREVFLVDEHGENKSALLAIIEASK